MQEHELNVAYVIPVDYKLHTQETPFCWDETCPCHEDQESIAEAASFVQEGLMTGQEAADFVAGRTI